MTPRNPALTMRQSSLFLLGIVCRLRGHKVVRGLAGIEAHGTPWARWLGYV